MQNDPWNLGRPMKYPWLAYGVLVSMMPLPDQRQTARVRITQQHLTALCLDRRPVSPREREWLLPAGEHALTVTMKNEPRPGIASADPGTAEIRFVLEESRRYEIEVRGPATSFSTRVWKEGEWRAVVRDRTADSIVSGEPTWAPGACTQSGR
jgi:hypothetical protein